MVESDMFIAHLSGKVLGLLTLEKRAWSMAYCGYVVNLLRCNRNPDAVTYGHRRIIRPCGMKWE